MRAAVLTKHRQPLAIETLPDPTPDLDGAIVRVTAAGVCRTDYHLWAGHWTWAGIEVPLPCVLGHEMAGVVETVGQRAQLIRPGQRVTVPFHMACGSCATCEAGNSNVCPNTVYLGGAHSGAFAELVAVPHADFNCIPLPDGVSDVAGAALGCRYMTAYHALAGKAELQAGEWVVILGAGGGTGLSAVQIAADLGARPIAVDINQDKLARAEHVGAEVVIHAGEADTVGRVREVTGGGAHVVIDTLAADGSLRTGLQSLGTHGRHVQVGLTGEEGRGELPIPIDTVVHRELRLLGVSGNPHRRYPALLELVAAGRCDPEALVSRRIGLADVSEVLAAAEAPGSTAGFTIVTSFAA